ncbi:hypothetical protein PENTCL1PPCAC_18615, partial [Pristionchus entomophagus]
RNHFPTSLMSHILTISLCLFILFRIVQSTPPTAMLSKCRSLDENTKHEVNHDPRVNRDPRLFEKARSDAKENAQEALKRADETSHKAGEAARKKADDFVHASAAYALNP